MNTEEYIIVKDVDGHKLVEAIQSMSNLYADVNFSQGIKIFKSNSDTDSFLINFTNIPDFEIFKYFVNYLHYPEVDNYKANVRGFWTIKRNDQLPKDRLHKRVMLYVSANDQEGDNVHAIFNEDNQIVQLGFAVGEGYQPLDKIELPFEENKLDENKYSILKTINPDPNSTKKSGKGCLVVLTFIFAISVLLITSVFI